MQMNMGPLFRNYQEFQDGDNKALNQAWGPPKQGTMYDCTGHISRTLASGAGSYLQKLGVHLRMGSQAVGKILP